MLNLTENYVICYVHKKSIRNKIRLSPQNPHKDSTGFASYGGLCCVLNNQEFYCDILVTVYVSYVHTRLLYGAIL